MSKHRLRDYGITIGIMPPGPRNAITDVPGVRVGHCTLNSGTARTGVTAIIPHEGNIFRDKVVSAAHVINGYGKTTGLMQVQELGTIETPILLTSTLSVGTVAAALVEYMIEANPGIGRDEGTVNAVVAECNDSYLNDARAGHVRAEHVRKAIAAAGQDFDEGAVGAGTGMTCYDLKGGIGTASRVVKLDDTNFTLGVLVLTNFGDLHELTVAGRAIGRQLETARNQAPPTPPGPLPSGSIIVVIATDAPATDRQLARIARRTPSGIARTGAVISNGSGELAIAFSTANRVPLSAPSALRKVDALAEKALDPFFRAVTEATEEAILNSMTAAETTTGRDGHIRRSLREYPDLLL